LNSLIDKLNEAIDKSTAILLKREKNPQNMKNLEYQIIIRQKELINTKNQTKIYRQQFEILNAKANERFTIEKYNNLIIK
jgi:hypothetical protein